MQSTDKSIAIALERARENVQKLEQLDTQINDVESWSAVIVQSLAFHREQRTFWRSLVHDLPAHLKALVRARLAHGQTPLLDKSRKFVRSGMLIADLILSFIYVTMAEQVLAEDLGGQFEVSADIVERKPLPTQKAVRLPPPTPEALAALRPTATPAAVELRKNRAAAALSESPDLGAAVSPVSPTSTCSDGAFATPEPRTSTRTGLGTSAPGLVSASRDPLRSARASPAQLPQGGLNELQAALARRRGGDTSDTQQYTG